MNFEIINEKNNSLKSTTSNKNAKKGEKKVKTYKQTNIIVSNMTNDNLNQKRMRSEDNSDYFCNEKLDLDIEFSSKNLISTAKFFSKMVVQKPGEEKKLKKGKKLDDFLSQSSAKKVKA